MSRRLGIMKGADWLDELAQRVAERLPDVETYRAATDTLTLSLGTRGVTAHDAGDVVLLSPSFTAGGTIGSRLADRVQYLEITSYGINEPTIAVAVDAVLGHLQR